MMKTRILMLALTLTLLLSLASCKQYRNDLSPDALSEPAVSALGSPADYTVAAEGYLDDYFTTPSYVSAYRICFATDGNNLDEFGIYHVEEGNASAMKTVLENYLTDSFAKNQTWYDSYIPTETPKLRDAEVKIFGNYVVYVIADKEDRAALLSTLEELLKQN